MVRLFEDHRSRANRALQIWLILISAAKNRQILTYGIVADTIGFEGSGTLGAFLGPIMYYCDQNGLPPLTVIVVNQETGLPGVGLITAEDLNASREEVFGFDWYGLFPPTPEEFDQATRIAEESD